jgi:hypothetical protein
MYSIDFIKKRQIYYYIHLQIYYAGTTRSL